MFMISPSNGRLNFVMLDEESDTMDAEIQEEWIPVFIQKIREGSVYYIRFFRVAQARNAYRAMDRPIMARFTRYTNVTEITPLPLDFPTYACSLVTFQTLSDRDNDNTVCSDIIGVFLGCTHVKIQGTKGGPKKMRNVYLSDGIETVSIALWGSHAEEFAADEYMHVERDKPLVFLFVGLTSRLFKTSISLQGSFICKWFVEPDLPKAHSLRERYIALNGCTGQAMWHGSALPALETEEVDVAALAAVTNPHTIYNKKYLIKVKIKCLKTNQQWWYHACDICNRHAIPEGDAYRCSVRKCASTRGGPRYRVPLIAIDPASSLQDSNVPLIELVVFGPKAEELLGVPVHNLIAMQSGIGSFLPSKITDLYGREFQMRISLSPSSLDRKDISIQVSSIFALPTINAGKQSQVSDLSAGRTNEILTEPDVAAANIQQPTVTQLKEEDISVEQREDAATDTCMANESQCNISLSKKATCTPPPHCTPTSTENKTYKRPRNKDEPNICTIDESAPLASLTRDKSRAAKRLKFDAASKEK